MVLIFQQHGRNGLSSYSLSTTEESGPVLRVQSSSFSSHIKLLPSSADLSLYPVSFPPLLQCYNIPSPATGTVYPHCSMNHVSA